jgi:NIMA (never in mitosis gene a)-related kinase
LKEVDLDRENESARAQAQAEAKFLNELSHPNIISVIEWFEEDEELFMIMEYAAGGDMEQLIKARNGVTFSEDEVASWLVQICFALKHIHDRKILHRDIKTPNIFLTQGNIVKLGDFGVAKELDSTYDQAQVPSHISDIYSL